MAVTLTGYEELLARAAALPDALRALLGAKLEDLVQALAQKVIDDKLSGQVLASKTGTLRDSIESSVEEDGDTTSAAVFVAGDVPYAAIQEYGGTTKAHIIEAINGKALAFNWQGKSVFFAHINHPGSVIPERSYLRSSLDDMQDDIVSGMTDALNEAMVS